MTPEQKKRDAHLRAKYGITLEQYRVLFEYQRGLCAVCLKPPQKQALHVDHDHVTKKVRGLLCYNCNARVVGRQRKPEILRAAARYLEYPPADTALLAI